MDVAATGADEFEDDAAKQARLDAEHAAALARIDAAQAEQMRSDQAAEDDSLGKQRRQNVRVDVQLPLVVHYAGSATTTRTRDLSATGIGFATRMQVEMDSRCEVMVDFGDWTFQKVLIIKFIKPILAGFVVGGQFEDLTADERERLVKQVFDVQRAQLNKGRASAR